MRRFRFAEVWALPFSPAAVGRVLVAIEYYPLWWPQVQAVARLGPDAAWVICRSRLPYSLDLVLEARSRELPTLECGISGDLEGYARWTIEPSVSGARVHFYQDVALNDRWLRRVAGVLRPVLEWNHRQMMVGCRRGLQAALATGAVPPSGT